MPPDLNVGTLMCLKGAKDKSRSREKYMVVYVSDSMCQLRKFTKNQFCTNVYDVGKSDFYL